MKRIAIVLAGFFGAAFYNPGVDIQSSAAAVEPAGLATGPDGRVYAERLKDSAGEAICP